MLWKAGIALGTRCSGAHPRFARNLGSGEPIGSATVFNVAEQEVFHDSDHPSAVILPVRPLQ